MGYSQDFFNLQIRFVQSISERFGKPIEFLLYNSTTFSKSFDLGDGPFDETNQVWSEFVEGFKKAKEKSEWTYQFYREHRGDAYLDGLTPQSDTFLGHSLFGCFYFSVRDEHLVRPHFIKNDPSEFGPLSKERMVNRLAEIKEMFTHIRTYVQGVDTVLGNSWMYNLEAYRRLFPTTYVRRLPESNFNEFQNLSRWGQFFDHNWKVKAPMAQILFDRLERLQSFAELKACFPLQILNPSCEIKKFYEFYEID